MQAVRSRIAIGGAALLIAATCWFLVKAIRDRRPYHVAPAALSGWKIVPGPPGDLAVVAMQPPAELSASLFQQVAARNKQPLAAPEKPLVPLVLQDEYADSLQGVLSIDDMIEVARGAGLDEAKFEPVCLAERTASRNGHREVELYVMFEAPAFADFRQQLTPLFPEHGGSVAYEPSAVHMMMPVAATDGDTARHPPAGLPECIGRIEVD
jgi:hypothetical protein